MSYYNTAALLGGSYNTAALDGGSYNTAALDGGSYNTAALDGGAYNTAALRGGARLRKGSAEARARMAYLRSLRGKKVAGSGRIGGGRRKTHPTHPIGPITFLGKKYYGGDTLDTLKNTASALQENPQILETIKKGANFWGNWIGENISHNRSTDAEIARLEAEIAAYERMSPEEKKAFKSQHRAAQKELKAMMPALQDRMKDTLSMGRDFIEKIKQAKPPPLPPRDVPPPLPPRDIPPPLPPRDIPPPLPPRGSSIDGSGVDMRDVRDGLMGPYGWIAMGVRKGKEKKLDALRDKWWDIRYN